MTRTMQTVEAVKDGASQSKEASAQSTRSVAAQKPMHEKFLQSMQKCVSVSMA
jgi:hypothetical protein